MHNKGEIVRAERAHERREQFLKLHGTFRLLEIKLLYEMWKNRDFEALGFESFKDYWEAPRDSGGLDISRSWAQELISVYDKYVVQLGQPEEVLIEVSPRKLYYLKEGATKENVGEIIAKASHMTLRDLELEKKKVEETTCPHDSYEIRMRCRRCDSWLSEEEVHERVTLLTPHRPSL